MSSDTVKPGSVRVLLVEDTDTDAELIERRLKRASFPVELTIVDTAAGMAQALGQRPDLVLSDYRLPTMTGLDALRIIKGHDPYLPFILVSGTIGEEAAIQALQAGVDDYILKDNLKRLLPAVEHQLRRAAERRARRAADLALRDSEARFRQLAENIDVFFYLTDPENSEMLYVSPAFERIWGMGVETLYRDPRCWMDAVHPEDRDRIGGRIREIGEGRTEAQYRIVRPDGGVRWLRARGFPVHDEAGRIVRIAGIIEDETERKESEERIKRLNRVHAMLSSINTLIVRVRDRQEILDGACRIAVEKGGFGIAWIGTLDAGTLEVTPVACAGDDARLFATAGSTARADDARGRGNVGKAIRERRPVITNDLAAEPDQGGPRRRDAVRLGYRSLAVLPLMLDDRVLGSLSLFAQEPHFFNDDEIRLLSELAGDIAFALDHADKEEKLNYLSYFDPVTGLANRTSFLDRLAGSIAETAAAPASKLGVVMMNVDRFKMINDTLGREAGDELLRQIAGRFDHARHKEMRHARLNADTFALITPPMASEQDLAKRMDRRLHEFFDAPFRIRGTDLRISVKAGGAVFPNDGRDADTLFRKAEAALKRAKQSGEAYLIYTDEMSAVIAETLTLENNLRRALERGEFVLHYQPKVDSRTGRMAGVEALIRWQSPERGLVPPGHFIALLEQTGLILQVGAWALGQAAADYRRWAKLCAQPPRIAVNVSPVQLRKRDFVDSIVEAIRPAAGPALPDPGIDLEITESLIMEAVQENVEKLHSVRAMGVEVAIDDFGTGYSSLGYLAKLPVQALKIDRSFVITMLKESSTMTLVSTVVNLAHSLGLKVVAEGVDDPAQVQALRQMGCDQMQGFLFSRPLPFEQISGLLAGSGVLAPMPPARESAPPSPMPM